MLRGRRQRKVYGCLVLCLFLGFLSSCTKKEPKWESRFLEHFAPTEKIIYDVREELQNIYQEVSYDHCTMRLLQTLGDGQTIYIALDVQFLEDVDLASLALSKEDIQEDGFHLWPKNMWLIEGKIDYEEIADFSYFKLRDSLRGKRYHGPTQIYLSNLDMETNTISYILCFGMNDSNLNGNPVTLLLNGFQFLGEDQPIEVSEKNYLVSWVPNHKGTILKAKVMKDQEAIGEFYLSRYGLRMDLQSSSYTSSGEAMASIAIQMKDGSTLALTGQGGESFSSDTGSLSIRKLFQTLISIENVNSIQVGDHRIEYIT